MSRAYLATEPTDATEAMDRIALLRAEIARITDDLCDPWQQATRGDAYNTWRGRALGARNHKEREIASLKAWLRKAGHEAHEERKVWRRALVAAQPALRAIIAGVEASRSGDTTVIPVAAAQLVALKNLLLPEETPTND